MPPLSQWIADLLRYALFSIGLAAVLFGGVAAWHYFQWYFVFRRRARREVRIIAQAIRDYVTKYGRIAIVDPSRDEQSAGELFELLHGYNCGAKCTDEGIIGGMNPENIDFLARLISAKKPNTLRSPDDPWSEDYHVAIDRNADGVTEIRFEDEQTAAVAYPIQVWTRSRRVVTVFVHSPLAVWSRGPNRRNQCGYGDDICSWK